MKEEPDSTLGALEALREQMDVAIRDLQALAARVDDVTGQRRAGRSYHEILTRKERPLVVEALSTLVTDLSEAGAAYRRHQAQALLHEELSVAEIADLFGVTRQRVSTLLQTPRETTAG
ncbi:hypothetical protein [Kineococcus sp. SYSU DK003]|uniref:hypothetical protein n=1 Tax=Kineococcus sp. SYSU DK003 TaxID=3383124 RepID=UPI003D7E1A25